MSNEKNTADILQPLPTNEWLLLRNTLKRDWPRFAQYYYWIDNAIEWIKKEPSIEVKIYCPEGKHDAGIFIGMSNYSMILLFPFAFKESESLLLRCIIETKCIDWSEEVALLAVHEDIEQTIRNAIGYLEKTMDVKMVHSEACNCYFKSKEECLTLEINIPDGFELKILSESFIPYLHELWPRLEIKKKPEKSINYISAMVRLNPSIAIFKKNDDKPVSWVLTSEWGGLGVLQTVEEYKGRGFAKIVVNALSKMLAEEGYDSTAFVAIENMSSNKLFSSLNFKSISIVTFIVIEPIKRI